MDWKTVLQRVQPYKRPRRLWTLAIVNVVGATIAAASMAFYYASERVWILVLRLYDVNMVLGSILAKASWPGSPGRKTFNLFRPLETRSRILPHWRGGK